MADQVIINGAAVKLVGNRVRDKHGKFVSIEAYTNDMTAAEAKLQRWKGLRKVWDDPQNLGWWVASVEHPDDLIRWGKEQRHCGGSHHKWVIIEKIWTFLTIIDPKMDTHGMVHLKAAEWYGKTHPDDKRKQPGYGFVGDSRGGTRWGSSTLYDQRTGAPFSDSDVLFDGVARRVIGVTPSYACGVNDRRYYDIWTRWYEQQEKA